jgi:hypothetical protein
MNLIITKTFSFVKIICTLVFTSKLAKKNFSVQDQEAFDELIETQGYFEDKPPSFEKPDGEWINEDDIFNKAVEEARFFNPEQINNNPDLIEAKDRYDKFQQTLEEADNDNEITKEVLEQYKQMVEELTKE